MHRSSWFFYQSWQATVLHTSFLQPPRWQQFDTNQPEAVELGVAPELGRLVTPQDDEVGVPAVAVISHGLWQRAFGGDRAAVGRDVVINSQAHTVVSVMPESFAFPPGRLTAGIWSSTRSSLTTSTTRSC